MHKIIVGGVEKNLSESTACVMGAEFIELKNLLNKDGIPKEDAGVFYWINGFGGDDVATIRVLKQFNLKYLGTEIGLAFLRSKFPCPAKD